MRKAIIIFSILISLITLAIVIFINYQENDVIENTYTLKTNYAFLSDGSVTFDIKVYTNTNNSLLKYATESSATLHDKNEEVVVSVEVVDIYDSSITTYLEEKYYEYTLKVKVDITKLKINDCYLSLKFTNKAYTFNIGSLEIKEKDCDDNTLKIYDLYGVSSTTNLTLSGIVITINNTNNDNLKITNISIGHNSEILLSNKNETTIKDSNIIEDYCNKELINDGFITVEANTKKTYILPIKHLNNNYLYNCYLLIECNGLSYYLSNYNYINSNDLEALNMYISKGIIYEF